MLEQNFRMLAMWKWDSAAEDEKFEFWSQRYIT